MIKQLLSSAGNNKEAGLATNVTKSANDTAGSGTQGLFSSILKTVQGFGQQEESQNTAKEESKQTDETATCEEHSVSKTASLDTEKAKTEKSEQVITGAEKVVQAAIQEQKKTEAEGLTQGDSESADVNEEANETNGEVALKGRQIADQADSNVQEATKTSKVTNTEKEVGGTAQAIDQEGEVAESTEQKISYEADSDDTNTTKIGPFMEESSETVKSDAESTKKGVSVEPESLKSEEKTLLHDNEAEIGSRSSGGDGTASSVNADGNSSISTKVSQKVVDHVSQQATQSKQVAENMEAKDAESEAEPEKVTTEHAVRMATEKTAAGAPEVTQGIQSQKIEEVREKRYRENYSFSGRHELNSERLEIITQSRDSKAAVSFLSQFEAPVQLLQNQANTNSVTTMTTEQELMLKEHLKESLEVTEKKDVSSSMFARLGEIPVSNMLIRRTVMPSLTQAVQKTISAGKATPETWQKHSFELEDGNSIQLSTRQVDGVLQVKLATTSVELSRLMQQYEQEIKQHLEQECQLDVNLQFDGGEQGQEMPNFFGNSSSSKNSSSMRSNGAGAEQTSSTSTDKNLQQSVRRFGYNQMEWTA
ncbi:hypothetical protein [Gracilimonas sp.]|uniref:hypothetical protein n=1 Tax=Gracilimonas sp. TaxID=1974203 RepID=UPI0032EF153E